MPPVDEKYYGFGEPRETPRWLGNAIVVLAALLAVWSSFLTWRWMVSIDVLDTPFPVFLLLGLIGATACAAAFWAVSWILVRWLREIRGHPKRHPRDLSRTGQVKVVAVIALLLCAIGMCTIPSNIEMNLRARIAKTRNAMRSLATAIAAYHRDHGTYPAMARGRESVNGARFENHDLLRLPSFRIRRDLAALETLTSPAAYVAVYPADPFAPETGATFVYYTTGREDNAGWILTSPGPDRDYDIDPAKLYDPSTPPRLAKLVHVTYDPTNGTASNGDIWRVKEQGRDRRWIFDFGFWREAISKRHTTREKRRRCCGADWQSAHCAGYQPAPRRILKLALSTARRHRGVETRGRTWRRLQSALGQVETCPTTPPPLFLAAHLCFAVRSRFCPFCPFGPFSMLGCTKGLAKSVARASWPRIVRCVVAETPLIIGKMPMPRLSSSCSHVPPGWAIGGLKAL